MHANGWLSWVCLGHALRPCSVLPREGNVATEPGRSHKYELRAGERGDP